MSIFAGNGVFVDEDDQTFVGEEVRGEVVRIAASTTNVERIDGLEMVEDGVYTWVAE